MTMTTHPYNTCAESFEYLYQNYRRSLFLHVFRMLQDKEATEDVLQETFLKAWRALPFLTDHSNMGKWLHRIAVNTVIDLYRSNVRRRSMQLSSLENVEHECVSLQYEDPQDRYANIELIRHTFSLLPIRYRVVLLMADYEHYPHKEIASRLQENLPSVRVRLARARKAFQRCYLLEEQKVLAPGA